MGLESFINGAGIASKALDYVDTAVQYYNQKKLNRQAQKDTQQNMQLQKDLNLQQQIDSYRGAIEGMRAAGINPAVAVGGVNMAQGVSSHPGSAGSAAKPENSLPAALEAGNALTKQGAEIANLEANTELQNAQAARINQEVAHTDTADYFINSHLGKVLENIRDTADTQFTRDFASAWIEENSAQGNNVKFDYGALDAFEQIFFNLERAKRQHEIEELSNFFDRKVMKMQLTNGAAYAVAQMPKDKRYLLYKNMMLMDAQISKLASDVSLNDKQKELINSQIAKYGQEIQSLIHSDPVAMYNDGDMGDLFVKLGFDGALSFMTASGYAIGAVAASRAVGGKAAPSTLPSGQSFNAPKPSKPEFKPEPIPSKPKGQQPKQLQVARLKKELEKMRSDGTKYFKPEVYRKKMDEYFRARDGVTHSR